MYPGLGLPVAVTISICVIIGEDTGTSDKRPTGQEKRTKTISIARIGINTAAIRSSGADNHPEMWAHGLSESQPNQKPNKWTTIQILPETAGRRRPQVTTPVERLRRCLTSPRSIIRALEVVEKDSVAIAESFTSLFDSLRLALAEVTSCSDEHTQCFSNAAGQLQESVLEAATKGNRYINSCLRLNEEMKGMENLAAQIKFLRKNVDSLDSAVNKIIRLS
ncbi:hypothetical protein MLD38_009272 [Melastoma candidum]|uniref:Uncharacterized protein n=1 Tax=Melastoma candidum TaxID=119954 RepID=A0ACB9S025_9MYRT|nr:hypothetical protein MLD38_009272 [Melastoma candidum]